VSGHDLIARSSQYALRQRENERFVFDNQHATPTHSGSLSQAGAHTVSREPTPDRVAADYDWQLTPRCYGSKEIGGKRAITIETPTGASGMAFQNEVSEWLSRLYERLV
jgi:hypothetical protein